MRPGWMRPSATSFSSASRATSRRTGSKHETTTVSGVSSMMTSTPVASSKARMFRPSRPMMRPFISSFGSATAETVVSAVCSAAMRWMASATIFFASRSALRRALSRISRRRLAGVGLRLLLQSADQLGLGLLGGHAGHLLEPAALLGDELLELLLPRLDELLAAAEVAGAPADLAVALLDRLDLPLEGALALVDPPLLLLHDPARGRAAPARPASRSFITSSLPVTTALFRIVSASRSASATIRFAVSSAVAFAAACRSSSARCPWTAPRRRPKKKKAGEAMTSTPSAAMSAILSIDLCSTARTRERENHRPARGAPTRVNGLEDAPA